MKQFKLTSKRVHKIAVLDANRNKMDIINSVLHFHVLLLLLMSSITFRGLSDQIGEAFWKV
jgi:hypothetical protein